MSEPEPQVWRVAMFGRVLATVIAAGPAAATVALWVRAALHPSVDRLVGALVSSGVVVAFVFVFWWMAFRPRLVLGARLELRSGWSVTVFALAEVYSGGLRLGRRNVEVAARQRELSRRG